MITHTSKLAMKEGERINLSAYRLPTVPAGLTAIPWDGRWCSTSGTRVQPLHPRDARAEQMAGYLPDVNYLAVTWNTPEQIQTIVERQGFRFHQVANDSALWKMFGVQQTPTTVVIDKQGVVRKLTIGTNQQKRDELLKTIRQLSAEK